MGNYTTPLGEEIRTIGARRLDEQLSAEKESRYPRDRRRF